LEALLDLLLHKERGAFVALVGIFLEDCLMMLLRVLAAL